MTTINPSIQDDASYIESKQPNGSTSIGFNRILSLLMPFRLRGDDPERFASMDQHLARDIGMQDYNARSDFPSQRAYERIW